ncbi:hypothetical protein [Actinophytocola sp.]|uniref:hypothetical protein n=1 Tax=Actinophytocola sp. TaxID=1872138 RepID=UPI002ED4A984
MSDRPPGHRTDAGGAPLQNRVLPTGEIVRDPARGMLMGNRGCIHDADRRLGVSRWRTKMWISCVLVWRDVRRDVMPPGRWTALFFLDEVTALAAGHRPCGFCRRDDLQWFAESWRTRHGLASRPRAGEMDSQLHAERVDRRTRRQLTRPARIGDLPDGAMVMRDGTPALVTDGALLPWSFAGYGPRQDAPDDLVVELLTPPTIVDVLAGGYRPLVHPSAVTDHAGRLTRMP